MTTIHHSPPAGATPFAIYEDSETHEPLSPSEEYEGDMSFNSELSLPGVDEAVPSIENEHDAPEEPSRYTTSYTSRQSILSNSQSRRVSGVTTTSCVSSLPSEISVASKPIQPANNLDSRYSPRKERPPFRNPASVRAMQMSSPPPLPAVEASRERLKGTYKLATPSRSGRSESMSTTGTRRRSHRDLRRDSLAHESAHPTPTPQQFPLVLLHITILPLQMPYSQEMMVKVMPEWLVENYRVLEEKLQDIILMRRGLLIPHPRDEYEVLEEQILESLELKVPRLLKCGHFMAPEEEEEDDQEHARQDDRVNVIDDGASRGSRMSGGTFTAEEEAEWKYSETEECVECYHHLKKPGKGVGAGTKRWDLKIYAANGLMRAGAWLAAWTEMERCDVEITPWIPEDVRKALDKRLGEEQEAAQRKHMYATELQRQIDEEAARQAQMEQEAEIQRRAGEIELQSRIEVEVAALHLRLEEEAADKRRLEESLYHKIEQAKETVRLELTAQSLAEANSIAQRLLAMENLLMNKQEKTDTDATPVVDLPPAIRVTRGRSQDKPSRRSSRADVPLSTLLRNYLVVLLQDSRNYLLVILTALVVYLAMNMNSNQSFPTLSKELQIDQPQDTISPVVITSTATMTATLTITELPEHTSIYVETPTYSTEAYQDILSNVHASSSPAATSPPTTMEEADISSETPVNFSLPERFEESGQLPGPTETSPAPAPAFTSPSHIEPVQEPNAHDHEAASPSYTKPFPDMTAQDHGDVLEINDEHTCPAWPVVNSLLPQQLQPMCLAE